MNSIRTGDKLVSNHSIPYWLNNCIVQVLHISDDYYKTVDIKIVKDFKNRNREGNITKIYLTDLLETFKKLDNKVKKL